MFYRKYGKRMIDFTFAMIALVILSPLFFIMALLVRANLGSPILFKQKRPGLNEKIFTIYKFRTMTEERDESGNLLADSLRLTKVGKFFKSTSLDELPELWNIVRGDMAIVGPRPLLTKYLPYYSESEKQRHNVRPGLTGLAQINGRNNLEWDSRLSLDIDYVRHHSFYFDIKIVGKTILKVCKREGFAVIDQASLQDLHIERGKKQISIKTLQYEDFLFYKERINEFLIDAYENNFGVSHEYSEKISLEKLISLNVYLNQQKAILIGAFDQEDLIGFAWIFKHENLAETILHVNHIIVDTRYRSTGIGKKLLSEVELYATKLCVDSIDLFVSENNKAAINLYEKMGFKTERRYLKKRL